MMVTVGIKALNEGIHIAAAIASAIEAVRPFRGEVILADCGSTDRTIAIAKQFPVKIFQLANPAERSCGAGAQLAFQSGRGDYFYILDGDMVLHPEFLPAAIAYLEAHPDVAGVGGRIRQVNTESQEYRIRATTGQTGRNWQAGLVCQLDCGGLYRSEIIRRLGYFADRNLHAFEEFELAARLQAAGWKLARIDAPAVDHFGHTVGGFRLLGRWLRSGYASAPGEVLRSAVGMPQLAIVLRRLGHIRNGAIVIVWWALLLFSFVLNIPAFAVFLLVPLLFLSGRRRSLSLGVFSLAMWNVYGWGLLTGLLRGRIPPERTIPTREITHEPATSGERRLSESTT